MVGERIGSYRIVDRLGAGGMGVVYVAQHATLDRRVAVKVLLPKYTADDEMLQRFFNEARASALIHHPGIVEVLDYGRHSDGSAFLTMELLQGESLAERLRRRRPLPIELQLAISRQLASALGAAHGRGIVHRDLKPDNVFLTETPDAPGGLRVKVLDFGIAKLAAGGELAAGVRTQTGALLGSPRYMSPEQCRGAGEVDPRSDVYSLGCLMFEMACGQPPFTQVGLGELLSAHLHEPPPRPRQLAPLVSAAHEALLLRALEKEAASRFGSMEELLAAIDAAAAAPPGEDPLAISTAPTRPLAAVAEGGFAPAGEATPLVTTLTGSAAGGEHRSAARTVALPRPASGRLGPRAALGALLVALAIAGGTLALRGPTGSTGSQGSRGSTGPRGSTRATRSRGSLGSPNLPGSPGSPDSPDSPDSPGSPDPQGSRGSRPLLPASARAAAPTAPAAPLRTEPVAPLATLPVARPERAAAPPVEVTLRIVTRPAGADVFRAADHLRVGRTPYTQVVARSAAEAVFLLRRDGYLVATVALPADRDGVRRVTLRPAPRRRPALSSTRPPRRSPHPPAELNDEAIDPFSE